MSDDVDPLLNIPYATIPDTMGAYLGDHISTVRSAVVFYIGIHECLVKNLRKEVLIIVSNSCLLISKPRPGALARHIGFEKISEVTTNADDKNLKSLKDAKGYAPFLLFNLVHTEPADLILLSEDGKSLNALFNGLLRVWSANRDFPQIRIKGIKDAQLSNTTIDHRVPKSTRNITPTTNISFALLGSKQQQRMLFSEQAKKGDAAIDQQVATMLRKQKEAKALAAMSQASGEAALLEDFGEASPSPNSPSKSLKRGTSKRSLERSTSKRRLEKSRSHSRMSSSSARQDPPSDSAENNQRHELEKKACVMRTSYPVTFVGSESRDVETGVAFAAIPAAARHLFKRLLDDRRAIIFFDKVAVNCGGEELIDSHLFFCPERIYIADSDDQVRLICDTQDVSNYVLLESLNGLSGNSKNKVSEGAVMMLREDMPDVFIGFKTPGRREVFQHFLKWMMASAPEPSLLHVDTCKEVTETGANLTGNTTFLEKIVKPSKRPSKKPLTPAEAASAAFIDGECAVPEELRKLDGNLEKGWVSWVGHVNQFPNPTPTKKKDRDPSKSYRLLCYVSKTHIYLSGRGEVIRCIDTKRITRIDVQTAKNKFIQDARKFRLILVTETPEFDCCMEHDWEDDGRAFIAAVMMACKLTKGTNNRSLPTITSFDDVVKGKYRWSPGSEYSRRVAELPISDAFLLKLGAFRNKIARYFVVNDQARVNDSLELAKEHHEAQEALFDKILMNQYHVLPETNPNILDYRGRLERFFKQYSPENIVRIPLLLERGEGAEEEMIFRLTVKFGPEPDIPEIDDLKADNMTKALRKIFNKYDADSVPAAREIREKHFGREKELMDHLRKQYGAAPDDPMFIVPDLLDEDKGAARNRMKRYAMRYNPDKIGDTDVDLALLMHEGTADDLFAELVSKFGPEPPFYSRRSRDRLRRFLKKYIPNLPDDDDTVDVFMSAFPSEGGMYEHLVKKYGPEPLPDGCEILGDIDEHLDLAKELAYADVPEEHAERFPTLVERPMGIFWFGVVSHWEPPNPPLIRYAFISSKHIYVADSEDMVRRCVPLAEVRAIYINTKRDLTEDRQCSVLFQVTSTNEHDLFLTFTSDAEAKTMLWIAAEILAKQRVEGSVSIVGTRNFDDVDSQCMPFEDFKLAVAPIPRRKNLDHPDLSPRGRLVADAFAASELDHVDVNNDDLDGKGRASRGFGTDKALGVPVQAGLAGKFPRGDFLKHRKDVFGNHTPNYRGVAPYRTQHAKEHPADAITQMQAYPSRGAAAGTANAASNPILQRQFLKHSIDGKFGSSGATWEDPSTLLSRATVASYQAASPEPDFDQESDPGEADSLLMEEDEDNLGEVDNERGEYLEAIADGVDFEHERDATNEGAYHANIPSDHSAVVTYNALDDLLGERRYNPGSDVSHRKYHAYASRADYTGNEFARQLPRTSMRVQHLASVPLRTSVNDFPDL